MCAHIAREVGGTGCDHIQEKLTLLLRVGVLLFMHFLVQPGRLKRPAHRLPHLAHAGLFRRLVRLAPSSGPTWATRVPSAPSTASGPQYCNRSCLASSQAAPSNAGAYGVRGCVVPTRRSGNRAYVPHVPDARHVPHMCRMVPGGPWGPRGPGAHVPHVPHVPHMCPTAPGVPWGPRGALGPWAPCAARAARAAHPKIDFLNRIVVDLAMHTAAAQQQLSSSTVAAQ